MRWIKSPLVILGATLGATCGITLGLASLHPLLATDLDRASSLVGLPWFRDRAQSASASDVISNPAVEESESKGLLSQLTQQITQRFQSEEKSEMAFRRALELAVQAMATRQSGNSSLQALQQEEFLWQAAIKQLQTIPSGSFLAQQAQAKVEQYSNIVKPVSQKVDQAQSAFLEEIAEATGQPESIHISLCHLSGKCRDYQGDQPPASPASLIKLPVAVVLMHKVETENIDLNQKIHIDSGNYTENAEEAKIEVDRDYPLGEVMGHMIKESDNIATNQLIDYLGWDYLNTTLAKLGFPKTTVTTKLVGESTYPTQNPGSAPNATTTNELTEMMRQVYTFQHPGDDKILDALVGQTDWDFGYQALKELDRKRVNWIGEKTGQNSKVIGSALAVKVDQERYVLTVTIDNSADQFMLRQIIQEVVQHLLDGGHLVETKR